MLAVIAASAFLPILVRAHSESTIDPKKESGWKAFGPLYFFAIFIGCAIGVTLLLCCCVSFCCSEKRRKGRIGDVEENKRAAEAERLARAARSARPATGPAQAPTRPAQPTRPVRPARSPSIRPAASTPASPVNSSNTGIASTSSQRNSSARNFSRPTPAPENDAQRVRSPIMSRPRPIVRIIPDPSQDRQYQIPPSRARAVEREQRLQGLSATPTARDAAEMLAAIRPPENAARAAGRSRVDGIEENLEIVEIPPSYEAHRRDRVIDADNGADARAFALDAGLLPVPDHFPEQPAPPYSFSPHSISEDRSQSDSPPYTENWAADINANPWRGLGEPARR